MYQVNVLDGRTSTAQPVNHAARIHAAFAEPDMPDPRMVKRLLSARAQRDDFFGRSMFGEPAWEMLLQLYLADSEQRRITVSALCGVSRAPASTALRALATLESRDLVRREPDRHDRRRYYISLSAKGQKSIAAFFAAVTTPI